MKSRFTLTLMITTFILWAATTYMLAQQPSTVINQVTIPQVLNNLTKDTQLYYSQNEAYQRLLSTDVALLYRYADAMDKATQELIALNDPKVDAILKAHAVRIPERPQPAPEKAK